MDRNEIFKKLGISSGNSTLLSSGFRKFDELIGGGFSNEIVTIASRPGHGKTSLLFNLMMNFSIEQDYKGVVAFPRMNQEEFSLYFISWITNLNVFEYQLPNRHFEKIHKLYTELTSEKIQVTHRVLSLDEIFTIAEIQKAQYIILDDYFRSYIWQYDVEKFAQDYSKIQSFIEKTGTSVFVSILTSRMAEKRSGDKRPMLCDIYRSDLVSTYSHKVVQLYRPIQFGILVSEDGHSTTDLMELLLQQNSKGKTGAFSLKHKVPFRAEEDFLGNLKLESEKNPLRPSFFDDLNN